MIKHNGRYYLYFPSDNTNWVSWADDIRAPADGRLLLITPQHKSYEVVTEVTVGDKRNSGLILFYNERAYAGLLSDGKSFRIFGTSSRIMRNRFRNYRLSQL